MVEDTIVKIQICFPDFLSAQRGKDAMVDEIMNFISYNEKIGYAGFIEKDGLRELISRWIHEKKIKTDYKHVTTNGKENIKTVIESTVQKCNKILSIPSVSVFVFPRVHTFDMYAQKMGYITGYTPRALVIHVYMPTEGFSYQSLQGTIAHEFNHAVFFNYHKKKYQTIRDALVFEGFAENFAEDVVGIQSPVSKVLSKKQSAKSLVQMFSVIDTKVNWGNGSDYRNIFLGDAHYKRWTGYSVGYHIVKSFREVNPDRSWEEIMKMSVEDVFIMSPFIKGIKRGL